MNEKDLSCLSYKELQALALKYRVPGNIKKHLLVHVLQAVKRGNETEVEKVLNELQQARKKKRLKKLKREKLSAISTPERSPGYAVSDNCYYPQQQPPYQWVGAVEEISSREDETMRVPDYEEFERMLLRKIQRDYQSYALNDASQGQVPSIVDLRMGAGSSILESAIHLESGHEHTRLGEDTNCNNQGPVLLKKMLEAPAGANLGAIAGPDKHSYGMWSSEKYLNGNNALDDSDTLTADSDIDNEEMWESNGNNINNNINNNVNNNINNNINTNINNNEDYFYLTNANKVCLSGSQANSQERNGFQEAQMSNNFLTDGTNHYQVVYPISEVQANCQKWIATNTFVNRELNSCVDQSTENSRGFHPIYYEETSGNSTASKPVNLDRKNQFNQSNENIIYEANQTILHEQIQSNEAVQQFYQSVNGVTTAPVNPIDLYYSQQMARRVGEPSQEFFGQESFDNAQTMHNVYQGIPQSGQFTQNEYKTNQNCVPSSENNGEQFNAAYYQQYPTESPQQQQQQQQSVGVFPFVECGNQPEVDQTSCNKNEQQTSSAVGGQQLGSRKENLQSLQSIASGALDPFWPRWPINSSITPDGQLETILNLQYCNYVDYAKIDQTSCVYCYTAPVVTQRIDAAHSLCTQKKRLVAECRQHIFSPTRLIYNDASTGMIMANAIESSSVEAISQPEQSSTDQESETRLESTTSSSDNSITDVWINDYTRYPVSSDNGPQSVDLIIDETEDLFAL